MWVRRLFLVPIVLGFLALAAWAYFVRPVAPPDARLACHYGAYEFDGGRVAAVTPTSGPQSLRITFLDGQTWRLDPAPGDDTLFGMKEGWTDRAWPGDQVTFGSCAAGTMTIEHHGPKFLTGKRQTLDTTDATFESHGLKLAGRLVMPRLEGAIPVAVLVHGSERDSAILFNRLQYLLPASGIGVFVYDKRGTGKSEGSYSQDFNLLSDDAAAALKKARELAGALASEVGFQGGSQAGWIEPLAARKANADFVVVGYGLAESPLAEDREEVFDDLRTAGYGEDVIAKAREITDATGRVMASDFTQGFDGLDAVRAKYEKEPWYPKIEGEFTGDFLQNPNWLLKILGPIFDVGTSWEHDPVPALKAYDKPHLWILAGRDSSAPSANTLRILREVQASRPNLDIVMFPTADHGIIEFEEKNSERLETRFSEGYFQLVADWILFKDAKVQVPGPVVYSGKAAAPSEPPQP
ncbi:MAG: alpha/beta hydrolase [Alphaproteobacteria bacterium]|nr:alpha/beta hydrolase [Alphaproteobacteria bacterium]